MEQEQKAALVRKMEGMRAEEAVPGFDREATWEAIAGRLDAPVKRRHLMLPRPWRLAAAAGVAGLLLGGGLVAWLLPGNAPNADWGPVTVTKQIPETAPADPQKTTAPAAEAVTPSAAVAATSPKPEKQATVAVAAHPRQEVRAPEAPFTVPPVEAGPLGPVEPASTGVARARTPRAAHLLDLESEDRTVLLDRGTGPDRRPALQLYLSARRLPPAGDDAAPSSVLRVLK